LGHAREEEQRITAAAAERTQSQITSLKAEIARIQSLLAAKTLEVSQAQQRNADVVASMQQYKIDSAATDRVRTELKSKTVAFQASALIPSAVTDNQRELTDKLVALKISVGTSEQQIERLQTAKNILVAENSMSELMVAKLEKDCSDKRRDLDNLDTATVISGHSTLARNSPQKSDQGVPIQAQPASPGLLSWVTFGLVGSGSSTP
jgi:regulator of replication initiation timing